jgi:NAD(P)-dependent dehydrogenase (short-subunit alcohol dehydrogenase family)
MCLARFTTALRAVHGVRVNCVVPDWIATERAAAELTVMTAAERAAAPTPVPMGEVADTVVRLVRDDRPPAASSFSGAARADLVHGTAIVFGAG